MTIFTLQNMLWCIKFLFVWWIVIDLQISISSLSGVEFIRGQNSMIVINATITNLDDKLVEDVESPDANFNFSCWVSNIDDANATEDLGLGTFEVVASPELVPVSLICTTTITQLDAKCHLQFWNYEATKCKWQVMAIDNIVPLMFNCLCMYLAEFTRCR